MKNIEIPKMIQIGSTGRNSGKTTIAKELISIYHESILMYGLKIITISGPRGKCQRGETGCGICTSITSKFELLEEVNETSGKDTAELLKAGCKKVYLLKVFHDNLLEGFLEFLQVVPANAWIICESNSIREVVKPGLFIMMNNKKEMKNTAAEVIDYADIILETPKLPADFCIINNKKDLKIFETSNG